MLFLSQKFLNHLSRQYPQQFTFSHKHSSLPSMKPFSLLLCVTLGAAVPLARRAIDCATAKYKDIMLTMFKTHRANHSVADLRWNKTLAGFAKTTSTTGTPGVHDRRVKQHPEESSSIAES
jgi:uncharacterized protein YkwD